MMLYLICWITIACLTFSHRVEAQRVSQQGADWYLRFRSERERERVETVAYRVTTSVKHRYSITKVERDVSNPCISSKEFHLKLVLPLQAVVTELNIETAQLMSQNKTRGNEKSTSSTSTNWQQLDVALLLPPEENLTLSVTYEEVIIPVAPMHYRLQMFHDVGEIVRDSHFSLTVDITEERMVRNLRMRALHPAIGDMTKETVTLPVEGNSKWGRVSLSLNTREQACYFGSRGVHGQLVVDWILSTSLPPLRLLSTTSSTSSSSSSSPSSTSTSSTPTTSSPHLHLSSSNLFPIMPETSYTVPKEYEEECRSSPLSVSSPPLSSSSSSSSSSTTGFSSIPSSPVSLK